MGGLLAFRVDNYDNTAEREQFRFLCERLKSHYENSNEFCVFVGNYNIGCELDALFIKKDAIIVIEFKNYGGNVVANENGEWTSDDKTIKGGSRKTVLQQARINHSIVKKELKVLGVDSKHIKDIPTLVVFHQPIELTNKLSVTTKSWLHITDNEHFIEKLDDITCKHTDLDALGIVTLAELLNLDSFYLSEFSNATYEKPVQSNEHIELFDDIKHYEAISEDTNITSSANLDIVLLAIDTKEAVSLKKFVGQILDSILKIQNYNIQVLERQSANTVLASFGVTVNSEYLVTVEAKGIVQYSSKISKFINRDVHVISRNLVCWEEGINIDTDCDKIGTTTKIKNEEAQLQCKSEDVSFRKSKTILPHWLDYKLFTDLDAKYSPQYERYEYNLDLNDDEVRVYLGTYFPRSYAESFCIFDNLLNTASYLNILSSLETINVLDIGCGTGGELIGLLVALDKHITINKAIIVNAIDGNKSALNSLGIILDQFSLNSHHKIVYKLKHVEFKDDSSLSINEDLKFEFIINSKVGCELISRKVIRENAYEFIAKQFSGNLSANGVLYILDVTTKDELSGLYYPQIMNKGLNNFVLSSPIYSTLLPLACAIWANCSNPCFMQQTFTISHSYKSNDESKVCYRIICEKQLKDKILTKTEQLMDGAHVVHSTRYKQDVPSSLCLNSLNGKQHIDSFNIKI